MDINSIVSLRAETYLNYSFTGWSINGQIIEHAEELSLPLEKSKTLNAVFELMGETNASVEISFEAGWNLVAFPFYLEKPRAKQLVGNSASDTCWSWNAVSQKYEDDVVMLPQIGYWVYNQGAAVSTSVKSRDTGEVRGWPTTGGWNLFGVTEAADVPADVQSVWYWQEGKYHSLEANEQLEPYRGYWLYIK